jgi:glucan phosphoethanolaminetransferase (alkaline phosphatase superfamily)
VNVFALAKVSLICIAISAGRPSYAARISGVDSLVPLTAYMLLFAGLLACVLLTAWIRHGFTRWALASLIGASFAFCDAYFKAMGEALTYTNFLVLLHTYQFAGDAFAQFGSYIQISALKGALLTVGIGLPPKRQVFRTQLLPCSASFIAVIVLSGMLYLRGGYGASGLHGSYVIPAYGALYAYEWLTNEIGERKGVEIARSTLDARHDIVFLIDESIRADYLDINSDYGVRSGLTETPAGWTVLNYGVAAAITNCSFYTNITLRYGGTRDDYIRINGTGPSIFQYAKHAGWRTVYIDGQLTGGSLQNGMDADELQFIDSFVQFDGVSVRERDMRIAETLVDLINDDVWDFVLVNKVGAHFPVHDKYPDELRLYTPTLERGRFEDVAHTGRRDGFSGTAADWERYRNSYRNTLVWSVGRFFDTLFAGIESDRAVILYTSDHGQELHENGSPGLHTHCRQEAASMEEGAVPLVVMIGPGAARFGLPDAHHGNYNRASHYNIFPTLLLMLGYDRQASTDFYGPSLADATEDPMTFNVRFDLRLGAEPKWRRIDVEQLARPPAGEGH